MPIPEPPMPVKPTAENPSVSKSRSWWREIAETLALIVLIFGLLYFVVRPNVVHGISMQPNYHDGEYILTSRINHWQGSYRRGDVVVLHSPLQDEQLIKRIIGLPGEQIKISQNHVIMYNKQHPEGFTLPEPYLSPSVTTVGGTYLTEDSTYTIPANHYIVLGDNRNNSADSRIFGSVNKDQIAGRATIIYWPIPSIGLIKTPSY